VVAAPLEHDFSIQWHSLFHLCGRHANLPINGLWSSTCGGCGGCGRQLCTTQPHRNRFARRLRFRATSAEVTAPPTIEERDALTPGVILTRLLACREVGDFSRRLAPVDLASARVALDVGTDIRPRASRGSYCERQLLSERAVAADLTGEINDARGRGFVGVWTLIMGR